MSKFTHAGVSRQKGKFKVRFANDASRIKILEKNGHKDLDIIELPNPMNKIDVVNYLLSINFDNGNAEVRAAIEAAKNKREKTTKADKKIKPSLDAIAARKVEEVVA